LSYVTKNDIKVVRRLTGGGAVYHDGGNLCYTIIAPYDENVNNYEKFTKPVIEYLGELGVNAVFSGRNDIAVDGKKISGNAQTVFNKRIMHHGTILFDADPTALSNSLNPNKLKMQSKGIKSVRARVINIKDRISKLMTILQFKEGLAKKFLQFCTPYEFDENDLEQIKKLVNEKYSRYEWNFGRSPKGHNQFEKKFDFGVVNITFDTEKGSVENVNISGDFFSKKEIGELCKKINGTPFTKESVLLAFSNVSDYIVGADAQEIVNAIFE